MKAMFEDTAGSYCFMDELFPHGPAVPPHRHEAADEIFYLIDGEATFFVGDPPRTLKATAGSLVFIQRQTPHSFEIDSPTARLLNAYTPAGFEHTMPPVSRVATKRALPPADLPATNIREANGLIEAAQTKYPGAITTVFAKDLLNHGAIAAHS